MTRLSAYILFFYAFLMVNKSFGQLEISNVADFEILKNTTTIVFMPASDTSKHLKYRQIIEENWKLTPLKFISYNQYVKYKNQEGYSYLLFGDDQVSNGTNTSSYVYLELWIWIKPDGINKKKRQLARMELYPDSETTYNPSLIYDYRFDTEGHIYNWSPGMLKNYIQMIQNYVEQNKKRSQYMPETDVNNILQLKDKTLYIPDYVLQTYNGSLVNTGTQSKSDLMRKYPFKYEFIDNKKLSEKILAADGPFYYLLFVRSNADKYVAVVEAKSGKLIYSRFRPISYNLRPADLKRLTKAIERAENR